jgi:hypothetical protein
MNAEGDAEQSSEPTSAKQTKASDIVTSIWATIIGLAVVGAPLLGTIRLSGAKLEVVTAARRDTTAAAASYWLQGRVLRDGALTAGAQVWAVELDQRGNRFTPLPTLTDSLGTFRIGPMPVRLAPPETLEVSEVRIAARIQVPDTVGKSGDELKQARAKPTPYKGADVLSLGRRGQVRRVELPMMPLVVVPTIFILTIILALASVGINTRAKPAMTLTTTSSRTTGKRR